MRTLATTILVMVLIGTAIASITSGVANAQVVHFVDESAGGKGDGTSWDDAFQSLQDALTVATAGDQVWVAQGRYRPDLGVGRTPGDRHESFQLVSGVMLLGGFEGTESSYVERDPGSFASVLSGDLDGNDQLDFAFREDNAYHVVTGSNIDASTLLDGFVVTGGHADGLGADSLGGGIFIQNGAPAIMNTTIVSNNARRGGGVYLKASNSELVNVVLTGNSALRGGAVYNDSADPQVISATIVNNFAELGAGIYNVDSSPVVVNSNLSQNGSLFGYLECQRAGYPCTLSEMDPDIVQSTLDLSNDVRERMEAESLEAAMEWLRLKENVVFVGGGDQSILFRIRNGPQMWVVGEEALAGKTSSVPLQDMGLSKGQTRESAAITYIDVVGEDTNNDGKRNNRDKKKALMLSPFENEFTYDEGAFLRDLFTNYETYTGDVDYFSNTDAGMDRFLGWDDYDVVHISTHGARECSVGLCFNILFTGTYFDSKPPIINKPGVHIASVAGESGNMSTSIYYVVLGRDFFVNNYNQGLDRTVVSISACESGDGDISTSTITAPDLGNAILYGGNPFQSTFSNSVFYGWDEVVGTSLALITHTTMYEYMLGNIWPTELAEKETKAAGYGTGVNSHGRTTTLRRWSQPNQDLYILEMVELVDDFAVTLEDGANITTKVAGTVDDDDPDDLILDALVRGIPVGTESQFEISFELDGNSLGPPVSLPSVDAFIPIDKHVFAIEDRVPAGRDLKSDETYTLEAVISMPGGGRSRYEAKDLEIDACYWELNLDGIRTGTYSGNDALFSTDTGILQVYLQSPEPNPISTVLLDRVPPVGSTATYVMALDGDGDGSLVVNFIPLYTTAPFQYTTGNGGVELDVDDNIVFTRPSPSLMSASRFSETRISGTMSGGVFAWTNLDPLYPTYEAASFTLRFAAEISHNADGSQRINPCARG